ncbi:hypothetical protein [Phenylobacterium sp.]|uniref:hypothetical protein n=1 Tax=Phenylobacterium sp. TaxID=1871053 RepID=UPI002735A371|nr:hypothetical protein [Phenylobacterium sp.]MDP3658589.1 hypothetical protein [Phenylobacterium sp.]
MTVSFEGFPRTLDRAALRPGRWFVAAEGLRAVLCLATDVVDGPDQLALTFSATGVEAIEFTATPLSALAGPFGTLEDEIVFAPGLADGRPVLIAPTRRAFRSGSLLRLRSGDLGVGFAAPAGGDLVIVSLSTGLRADGFELVFERWSLSLRRGAAESLIGYFKPVANFADRRRI